MSYLEQRTVIKSFTCKGLRATEIKKELDDVYMNSVPSHRTIAKWVTKFKNPQDAPRSSRPPNTTDDKTLKL